MMVDITAEFRALVKQAASNTGKGGKPVDASILRPVRRQTAFTKTVTDVSLQILQSREFLEAHRHKYVIPGMVSDGERDKMEAEIVSFIKSCSTSVEHLSKTVAAMQEQRAMGQLDMSEQAIAHRHGMVLIVAEELKELTLLLDKYRSEHAIQLKTLTQRRQRQRQKQEAKLKNLTPSHDPPSSRRETVQEEESGVSQAMLQEESQALFEELTSLSTRVHDTEKMMVEISTLNQMLSSQILGQSEQIEQIYSDAVEASQNMTRGNTHLKKAVNLNKSTLKYVAVLLILASLMLLFFDHFYS